MEIEENEIKALPLSVRSRNALYQIGIHTIAELIQLDEKKLNVIRNFGIKSKLEVLAQIEKLKTKDFHADKNNELIKNQNNFIISYSADDFEISQLLSVFPKDVVTFIKAYNIKTTSDFINYSKCYNNDKVTFFSQKLKVDYLMTNNDISSLIISNKLLNFLSNRNCNSISAFFYSEFATEIMQTQGMGKKTLNEYVKLKSYLKIKKCESYKEVSFIDINQKIKAYGVDIAEMGFSVRTNGVLKKAGIYTLLELINTPEKKLKSIGNFGKKSQEEIKQKISEFFFDYDSQKKTIIIQIENESRTGYFKVYKEDFSNLKKRSTNILELFDNCKQYEISSEKQFIDYYFFEISEFENDELRITELKEKYKIFFPMLSENEITDLCRKNAKIDDRIFLWPELKYILRKEMTKKIESLSFGITKNELFSSLSFCDSFFAEKVLKELKLKKIVQEKDNLISVVFPSVKIFIRNIQDIKKKEIATKKIIEGLSLEEIGKEYSLTRERIRQILRSIFYGCPQFEEDKYKYIYEKYRISQENIKLLFGEIPSNYLRTFFYEGDIDLEECLTDEKIPQSIRRKIEKQVIYKDYIKIGNSFIRLRKMDLFNFYIRKNCKNESDIESVLEDFNNNFLNKYKLKDEYKIEYRSFTNTFVSSKMLLYKGHGKFRFYPFSEYDFSELLENVCLEQYSNIEISTKKIFLQLPKIMKKYSIKDEYELHNLLRKLYEEKTNIDFKRMPTICFGSVDRKKQIFELLVEKAPIASDELAKAYEYEYGVNSNTVKINIFPYIKEYLYRGVYNFEQIKFSENEIEKLRSCLIDDFYTMASFINIIHEVYPSKNFFDLSPLAIRALGYTPFDKYVISKKYKSAADYFEYLLSKKEIFSLNEINNDIVHTGHFYNVLNSYKHDLKIIEFKKNEFISISRLGKKGITKDELVSFSHRIYENKDIPVFFSLQMIRNLEIEDSLFDLGFENLFYESILMNEDDLFSCASLGKVNLFSKRRENITFGEIIKSVFTSKIDIYRLLEELEDRYGMKIGKTNLLEKIQNTDLYYDKVFEKVYLNYELYLEEI